MPKQKRRKAPQDLNGSKLQRGQQRLTPGQFKEYDYSAKQTSTPAEGLPEPAEAAVLFRHPDLAPLTLSGLTDAFRLNHITFSHVLDGQYDCTVTARGISRVINPYDGADVLQFFKDVINRV